MSESLEKENLNNESAESTQADLPEKKPQAVEPEAQSTIFVKHIYDTKKPIKDGSKKRILICVIAGVLCAAIIGSIFLINKLIPDDEQGSGLTSSMTTDNGFVIFKKSDVVKDFTTVIDGQSVEVDTNIKSVRFVNGNGEFTCLPYFVKAEKKDDTSSSSTTSSSAEKTYLYDTKWYIDGIDKSKTESSAIATRIKNCLTIRGVKKMENTFSSVEEYHKYYGMKEKLLAGCEIQFNDGTPDLNIYVGSALATGDAYYFRTSLSDDVYVIEANYADYFNCSTKEFADGTIVEPIVKTDDNKAYFNDSDQLARFDTIKLSGEVFKDKSYEFKLATGASADYMPYLMTVPYKRPASDEFISKILLFAEEGLEASALYSYSATDKEIKECGFDNPKCVIEFTLKDYSFKLSIGGALNDGTDSMTALVEGKDMVYGIAYEDISFLVNASNDITQMFNDSFILEDIYTIKSFEMNAGDGNHKFDLTHTPRDGDEKVKDTVVKKGNTVMDTKSFKLLYQRVLMLSLMEYVTEAEHSEPVLAVRFNFAEGGSKLVEFTESPDDIYHYIAWADGTPLGEVLKASVTDIIDCLDKYLSGEQVPDTWSTAN